MRVSEVFLKAGVVLMLIICLAVGVACVDGGGGSGDTNTTSGGGGETVSSENNKFGEQIFDNGTFE